MKEKARPVPATNNGLLLGLLFVAIVIVIAPILTCGGCLFLGLTGRQTIPPAEAQRIRETAHAQVEALPRLSEYGLSRFEPGASTRRIGDHVFLSAVARGESGAHRVDVEFRIEKSDAVERWEIRSITIDHVIKFVAED